jgi:flavodoxin
MTQILMVSYSQNESTQTIARQLARACKADLEFIEHKTNGGKAFANANAAVKAAFHVSTPIHPAKLAPANYDLVVIGTPVRLWNVPGPVRSYIQQYRSQFKRIALFCTHGGFGHEKVLRDLTNLCGRPVAGSLAISNKELIDKKYFGQVARFASMLKTSCKLRSHLNLGDAPFDERRFG